VVAIDRRDDNWSGLPPKFDFRFETDLVADLDIDTDGEGRSSTLVPGVAGANSDLRGRGTLVGSACQSRSKARISVTYSIHQRM
jgi:hypothetical protein